jgi:hypothetical protein
MMKAMILSLIPTLALAAPIASTNFTLGLPTADCIPVNSQDGVPGVGGAYCPLGFFGGGGLQMWLPRDPLNPGHSLTMYFCSDSLVSDTGGVPVAGAVRAVTYSLTCPGVEEVSYSATWSGNIVFHYTATYRRYCTSGRGSHCFTGYVWVNDNASGALQATLTP